MKILNEFFLTLTPALSRQGRGSKTRVEFNSPLPLRERDRVRGAFSRPLLGVC